MRRQARSTSSVTAALGIAIGLVIGGVATVWAQGSGTVDPPPSVAFVATAFDYPDALAVGPVAGRLGAPLLLTAPDALSDEAADGLATADPDLVVIAGGTAAISQAVEDQIAGLLPGTTIERVAGAGRAETAELLAELIASFDPAWLPVGATAADADLLDGMDSTEFLPTDGKADDADLLDGMDSTAFLAESVFWFTQGSSGLLPADESPQTIVQVDVPDGTYAEMHHELSMEIGPPFEDRDWEDPEPGDWDGQVDCLWVGGTEGQVAASSGMNPLVAYVTANTGSTPFRIAGGDGLTLECTNNLTIGEDAEQAEITIHVGEVHLKPVRITALTER